MKILVLNGSPRPNGNTAAMAAAFAKGARENGHQVDVISVCRKKIAGCLACEYCHKKDSGHERQCVQQDDMQEIYPLLDEAEMIVLASPSITTVFPASSSVPSIASMHWINRSI